MRESSVKIDLKSRGLEPYPPSASDLGITRLMNLKPGPMGLSPEYQPANSNSGFISIIPTTSSWHDTFLIYDNQISDNLINNYVHILYKDGATWSLVKKPYSVDASVTPPVFSIGTQTSIGTFSRNGITPPQIIQAEGVALVSDGSTVHEISLTPDLPGRVNPSDVPAFLCGCYYNGQFIVGNIPAWTTKTGNSQSMIAWSDIGNTNFVAGTESVLNTITTPGTLAFSDTQILSSDNTVGFAQLNASDHIVGMHALADGTRTTADGVAIMTKGGIFRMTPTDNTWSIQRLTKHNCIASCLGDHEIIFIDGQTKKLYKLDSGWQVKELGYEHLLGGMASARFKLRYFPEMKAYQIYQIKWLQAAEATPLWENNFILNQWGLYQTSFHYLANERIPFYQKTFSDVGKVDRENMNNLYLITAPIASNTTQDCFIGLGPTNWDSSDSVNIRDIDINYVTPVEKVAGVLNGLTLGLTGQAGTYSNPNTSQALTPQKTIPLRDLIVYPNFSAKNLYLQLTYVDDNSDFNKDITLTDMTFHIIREGSVHRRSQRADSSNPS